MLMTHWTGVKPTGEKLDKTDYLLGEDQTPNRCGQAYGPMFLLINDIAIKDKGDILRNSMTGEDARQWDPW